MKKIVFVACLFVMVGIAGVAEAGTDSTFTGVFDMLSEWCEGSLGKLIGVSVFIVGMGCAVVKQSVMTLVADIAFAIAFTYGPGVLSGVFSGTA